MNIKSNKRIHQDSQKSLTSNRHICNDPNIERIVVKQFTGIFSWLLLIIVLATGIFCGLKIFEVI